MLPDRFGFSTYRLRRVDIMAERVIPVSYAVSSERTSPIFCLSFAAGCGGRVVYDLRLRSGPVAMFGSQQLTAILKKARAHGRAWYYGDHGYFRRFKFYRVTLNAFQHDGLTGKGDPARLKELGVKVRRWRKGGRHVLVCPPDAAYAARNNFSEIEWLNDVRAVIEANSDRPIRVRDRVGAERNPVSLEDDLEGAWALVAHHSNAAVEALIVGIPVFVTGDCAALQMACTDLKKIETPCYPEGRARWASVLAANQWTLDEMAAGDCWRKIAEGNQ